MVNIEFADDDTVIDPAVVLEDVATNTFDKIAVIGTINGRYALWSSHDDIDDFVADGLEALHTGDFVGGFEDEDDAGD